MKKILHKVYAMLAVTLLAGCNDFLDVSPQGERVENDLFSTAQGFEQALYGAYASLNDEGLYGKSCSFWINDVLAQYFTKESPSHTVNKLSNFNFTDANVRQVLDKIWNAMYTNISNVNNILKNLDNRSEAHQYPLYAVYRAEALALRGFMHFELTRYYCENLVTNPAAVGVPYRDKYDFKVTTFDALKETYRKIIADLQEAERLMGEKDYFKKEQQNENVFDGFLLNRNIHLNLHAVRAMLARVYWFMGDLDSAQKYARKVIDSKLFEFEAATDLEKSFAGILSPKETVWGVFSSSWHITIRNLLYYTSNGDVYLLLKDDYLEDYQKDKEGVDYRLEKWMKDYNTLQATGTRCIKVLNQEMLSNLTQQSYDGGINMIRIPELYYIVAEYYLKLNDQENACKYFDPVISARGLTPMAQRQQKELTLEILNNERRKEFISEGQYFFTMKRYNMSVFESVSGKTYPASKEIYTLPIPTKEIDYRN